ncbi:MAG: FtsW/RodA/SpoVE family cell cycle protein [Candidatus Omnitrophota bacterium]|nr:rod shape-determining protein RodA [Candidatus Omnitrophota bacterium]MBU2528222.1 rod shape-determining protein RodA [bacterium]MBU3929600.1 rod shape-determining protein RodA [bacterium]MBU4122527.1 rod shape-determining protein RodA [bacterium]
MKRFDPLILFPALFLLAMGSLQNISYVSGDMLYRHLFAIALGFAGMVIFTFTKYKSFLRFRAIIFYVLGIALLILTLAVGYSVHGSRSWLGAGFIVFQPSEIAKFTTVIFLTYFLSKNYTSRNSFRTIFFLIFFSALPLFLVLKQPDFGTGLVFVFIGFMFLYFSQNIRLLVFVSVLGALLLGEIIFFCMRPHALMWLARWAAAAFAALYIAVRFLMHIKKSHIAVLVLFGLFFTSCLVSHKVATGFKSYQKDRILNFISPNRDTLNSGYHLSQSLIAIGSGKIKGKGYRRGTQARLGFLPGKYTDFMFASIAEEFGFIGSFLILFSYFILFSRMIKIAVMALDQQGTFLALSILGVLFFQTFLNIGMTLGMLPITGLPLPFLSYGGTATAVYLMMLGVVMNVYATAKGY